MADLTIPDLNLIDNVSDDTNFAVDDSIQSYRATAPQIKAYVLDDGNVETAALADDAVETAKIDDGAVTAAKLAAAVLASLIPAGTILATGRSTAPTGFLLCDGSAVSRSTYGDLFTAIGTTFGSGNGSTTFNLPNTQGVFLRGTGSQTVSGKSYSGPSVGANQADQFQGHKHEWVNGIQYNAGSFNAGGGAAGNTLTQSTGPANVSDGTNGTPRAGDETRPVNLGVNYMIKT